MKAVHTHVIKSIPNMYRCPRYVANLLTTAVTVKTDEPIHTSCIAVFKAQFKFQNKLLINVLMKSYEIVYIYMKSDVYHSDLKMK